MHPLVTSRPTFYNGSPRVLKLLVLMAVKRRTSTAFSSYFPLCPKARFPLQLKTLVSLPTAHVIPFTTTSDYRSLPPISLTLLSTPRGPVAPFFPAFASFAAWLLLLQSISLPVLPSVGPALAALSSHPFVHSSTSFHDLSHQHLLLSCRCFRFPSRTRSESSARSSELLFFRAGHLAAKFSQWWGNERRLRRSVTRPCSRGSRVLLALSHFSAARLAGMRRMACHDFLGGGGGASVGGGPT